MSIGISIHHHPEWDLIEEEFRKKVKEFGLTDYQSYGLSVTCSEDEDYFYTTWKHCSGSKVEKFKKTDEYKERERQEKLISDAANELAYRAGREIAAYFDITNTLVS